MPEGEIDESRRQRALVNDGETIVLGGVFREETAISESKTPVLEIFPILAAYLSALSARVGGPSC